MHVPGAVIWNLATFREWYDGAVNQFFDEEHEVKSVNSTSSGDQAEVSVVVHWNARWWEPAAAKSKYVDLRAIQKWIVRRSRKNDFGLEIVYYDAQAEPFKLTTGSDPLPPREAKASQGENLRAVYDKLCASYHQIDDFRAKLLNLLPLATGTGIFLLTDRSKDQVSDFLGPIGLFGAVVTLGLFAYEIYGILKCGALIATGKKLEGQLGIEGQFISRPRSFLGFIDEPFAAGIIYPAVLAAWGYMAWAFTFGEGPLSCAGRGAGWFALGVFLAGFLGTRWYDRWLRRAEQGKKRDRPKQGS